MSELIDRQAVIDAIEDTDTRKGFSSKFDKGNLVDYVKALPSAELPSTVPSTDLISRQKALHALVTIDTTRYCVPCREVLMAIKNMPSAEPQIIYCKDCEYFKRDIPCSGGVYNGCEKWLDNGNEIEVGEYDWCSKRKRKSNG